MAVLKIAVITLVSAMIIVGTARPTDEKEVCYISRQFLAQKDRIFKRCPKNIQEPPKDVFSS